MKKIKITKIKSTIHKSINQKRTMSALGLNKISSTVTIESTPQITGMIKKVHHLVSVEEVK